MEEDPAARRGSQEEGLGRGEGAAGAWDDRGEWGRQGLSAGPGGQEGREAAGPEAAAEPGPADSGGRGGEGPAGRDRAAPEGRAAAGLGRGRGGGGRGEKDLSYGEGRAGEEAETLRASESRTLREASWEGSQRRHREREEKRRAKGTEPVGNKNPLEKQPNLLKDSKPAETKKNAVLKGETRKACTLLVSEQQRRRPTIRFSLFPRPRRPSQWSSVCHTSVSVINELAKMGDPDVLEMVQEEGRSRRPRWRGGARAWARGPRGTLAALRPGSPGTFSWWRALLETGAAK